MKATHFLCLFDLCACAWNPWLSPQVVQASHLDWMASLLFLFHPIPFVKPPHAAMHLPFPIAPPAFVCSPLGGLSVCVHSSLLLFYVGMQRVRIDCVSALWLRALVPLLLPLTLSP